MNDYDGLAGEISDQDNFYVSCLYGWAAIYHWNINDGLVWIVMNYDGTFFNLCLHWIFLDPLNDGFEQFKKCQTLYFVWILPCKKNQAS